jgi:hypothetical protein
MGESEVAEFTADDSEGVRELAALVGETLDALRAATEDDGRRR